MVDVYLASDNVTVLGGPAIVSLDVDFGPTGDRGSVFFVGNGNPNLSTTVIGQSPRIFDMYINLSNVADPEYLFLYQYQNADGQNSWVRLVKLIPNTYSENNIGSFIDGSRNIEIKISDIVEPENIGSVTSANLNVQYNILGSNPLSSSMLMGQIEANSNGDLVLPISIKAIEFVDNSWINLAGNKTVQISITVV